MGGPGSPAQHRTERGRPCPVGISQSRAGEPRPGRARGSAGFRAEPCQGPVSAGCSSVLDVTLIGPRRAERSQSGTAEK